MMRPDPMPEERGLVVERTSLAEPFELIYVPVSTFPMAQPESHLIGRFLDQFIARAAARWKLNSEVFLQLEQLHGGDCRLRYARHASEWMPEIGIGVWPDREPPSIWSREELLQLAPGERPRPLMYQVFWVSGPPPAKESARNVMFDIGPVLQIMTSDEGEAFLRRGTDLFQPQIADLSLACYPFYVPLLERKTLAAADVAQLTEWLCGATIYIRQSIEDQGVLIFSKEPLQPLLEELGAAIEDEKGSRWRVPSDGPSPNP